MSLSDFDRYERSRVYAKQNKENLQTEIEEELKNKLKQQQVINRILEEQQWEEIKKFVMEIKKGAEERTLNIKNVKGFSLLETAATNIIERNDYTLENIEKLFEMYSNFLVKTNKTIGKYSIKIISQYFGNINDFENLEMVSKNFRGIFEMFDYNPIPLTKKTRKFFPNLKTLHLYNKSDTVFNDGKIIKYCIWYNIDYKGYLEENKNKNDCKSVCYTKVDRNIYGNEIPEKVKILGSWCFTGCKKLISMKIPKSITELRDHCFENCINLSSISLPTSICRIRNSCFKSCVLLKSIELPENLNKIEYRCFDCCLSLSSIKIPSNVVYLGDYCFNSCKSLTSIEIPSLVTKLSKKCFFNCVLLSTIVIPSSVVEIGEYCFEGCLSLNSLEIPNSVTKLGHGCFYGCDSLNSLTTPSSVAEFMKDCFGKS